MTDACTDVWTHRTVWQWPPNVIFSSDLITVIRRGPLYGQPSVLRPRVNLGGNDWVHSLNTMCWVLKILLVNDHKAIINIMLEDGMCVFHMTFWPLYALQAPSEAVTCAISTATVLTSNAASNVLWYKELFTCLLKKDSSTGWFGSYSVALTV